MRQSRFTEEQIALALRQAEAGTPVSEICRKLEITETTFYRWQRKCAGALTAAGGQRAIEFGSRGHVARR